MTHRTIKPKYMQLKEEVLNWIATKRVSPGDRLPSENELAAQFGMSRQTVRLAISELVHEGILFSEQGRGTFVKDRPNHREQANATHTVGVITTYISDYIFPSIIRGIESRLAEAGYTILLLSTHNDFTQEARALQTVLQKQVDAVIVEPTKSAFPNPNLDLYLNLVAAGIPLITLHSSHIELGVPTVRIDDFKGERLAVEHLISKGHQRIGGVFKSDDLQGRYRLKGFIDTMKAHGLPVAPERLSLYTTDERQVAAERYVDLILNRLTDETRPTAIACYNDEIAVRTMRQLRNRGVRIPEDIAVAGFDDSQYAETGEVELTTVRHPKNEMGIAAADMVLNLMRGNSAQDVVFDPSLIVRAST